MKKSKIDEINKRAREVVAENIAREPNGRKQRPSTKKRNGGPRSGAGRPPGIHTPIKPKGTQKHAWVTIRLSADERDALGVAAEAAGLSVSDYVRSQLAELKAPA